MDSEFPEGIASLHLDDQVFVEAVAEWLHEDAEVDPTVLRDRGEKRRALLVFQWALHADIIMRELSQLLDLRRQRRDEYVTPDGTILTQMVWTGHAQRGRYHDAIFMHPTVDGPWAREAMIPATSRFWNG